MKATPFTLETTAKILIRSFWMATGILFLTFFMAVGAGDMVHEIHESMFGVTRHEFDLMIYGWIGILKILILGVFLFPYIAIRMVLREEGEK